MYKLYTLVLLNSFLLGACNISDNKQTENIAEAETPVIETEINEILIKNLLRDSLALADSVEIVMSYLEVPQNSTLPSHFHPGEEFVYMLEGSGELTMFGDSIIPVNAGEVMKIPLKEVHSFATIDEACKIVVFRVHQEGKPDRILVK